MMSSMVKRIFAAGLLMASVASAAALTSEQRVWYAARMAGTAAAPGVVPPPFDPTAEGVLRWKRLRQSDNYPFADYAGFLLAFPGWPDEAGMRRAAERKIDPNSFAPQEVVRFFDRFPPITTTGEARYAEALAAIGRTNDARNAARTAWLGGALSPDDENRLRARFGTAFTQADHDRRMERLLWDRSTSAAGRQLGLTSPVLRPLFEARLAMQTGRSDATAKAMVFATMGARNPGFVADRARWLRDNGRSVEARAFLAGLKSLEAPPLDAEEWLEILLLNARAAANDNQSSIAFEIARQADSAFPAGTEVRDRSLGERDDYTSLVWLGGTIALRKLNRPGDAVAMFDRYARAAQTPQTQTKGLYWAGRAALAVGDRTTADRRFATAATHPDQFYGQLASERLGRMVMTPQVAIPSPTLMERDAFERNTVTRAARLLGELGAWRDQSLFLRVIAQNARSDADHVLATEFARAIGRPDLGVMAARNARNTGRSNFVASGFPQVAVPATQQFNWVMIHAIARQESQFDREAVSHAGARGLMQLMPGTAREQASKLGLPYDFERLTRDPSYNITLGSSFFQRMLNYYGGSHVLAVASYNAGPGNVNKWLRANGDPRMAGVDVLDWIEAIPLSETRGYVQRVLENAVVYGTMNPQHARMPARNRLSAYLGKSGPG